MLDYLEAKRLTATTCDQVDERWVKGFRAWSEKEPIVSPTGKERPRSLSTIEGHDRTDPVTSPYAPFQPTYLKRALAEIEAIIDEILTLVPSAFHRSCTGAGADVVALGGR